MTKIPLPLHLACHDHPRKKRLSAAFTLVEMLVVIAIIGVLTAMMTPALPSILESKSIERAAAEVAGVLETARAEAMSKRTYVHVVFTNASNAERNSEIRIGALASLDGTTDVTPANLRGVSRVAKVDRAQITGYSDLSDGMKTAVGKQGTDNQPNFTAAADYATASEFRSSINLSDIPGFKNFKGSSDTYVVTITPQGEIKAAANDEDRFRRAIHFGITETRRTELFKKSHNGAIVTYYGGSGRIGTLRP